MVAAAENPKEKTRVLSLIFQQVVASHVEDDFKPLTAPTFVNIFLLFPVGVAVLVYPFHLGGTPAPGALNAVVIHLCLPLLGNLLCCFHSLSPLLNFWRLYFLPLSTLLPLRVKINHCCNSSPVFLKAWRLTFFFLFAIYFYLSFFCVFIIT